MKYLLACSTLLLTASLFSSEKVYIDKADFDDSDGSFHLHIGDNIWLETNTIHRDETGLFIFEHNLVTSPSAEMQKTWKCPYCYRYWPVGSACKNKDCPSKYK